MTDVRAVCFDLDGTLCAYRRSSADLLALAHDRVGVDPFVDADEYVEKYGELAEDSEDVVDLRERCFVAIAEEKGRDPDVAREMAAVYAAERDHRNVEAVPGAIEALEAVSERYPVALVTNGAPEMQADKTDAVGITGAFDVEVYAGYDGTAAKPSPEPFHAVADELGVEAAELVHVGDTPSADVAGARAAGARSVLLAPDAPDVDPDPRPDHLVSGMDELVSLPWER